MASKHHRSHQESQVLDDITSMSNDELEDLYGIEIGEDGSVFDTAEFKEFDTLADWAAFVVEQEQEDNYSSFTKIKSNRYFDDDDY